MKQRVLSYRLIALLVAVNYFGFRTELFRSEYEDNHPVQCSQPVFTTLSLNWETIDKDNAPTAFVVHASAEIERIGTLSPSPDMTPGFFPPFQPVHDKSPPGPFKNT